jgi:hypothetical protein
MTTYTPHGLWRPLGGCVASRRHARPRLCGRRRRRSWKTRGLVALCLSGLVFLSGVMVGNAVAPAVMPRPVAHDGPLATVMIVPEPPLPPVLQRIARCESQGRHWTKEGQVVRGTQNPHDVGLFQINTVLWGKQAQALGYDLRTVEGNTQMARHIFEHYGSGPWQSSAACWNRGRS